MSETPATPPSPDDREAAAEEPTPTGEPSPEVGQLTPRDIWWMAKPKTVAGVRWDARMQAVRRWDYWLAFGLFAVFVVTPSIVLELTGTVGTPVNEADPGWLDWFRTSWSLVLALPVVLVLMLGRFVRPFDLGLTLFRTIPRDREATTDTEGVPRYGIWAELRFVLKAVPILALIYLAAGYLLYLFDPTGNVDRILMPKELPLITVFAMVVAAPIGEELIFRSILYPVFRRDYGPFFGAIINAVLFGVMHAAFVGAFSPMNINHIFGGFVFCYAYERTGSVRVAMLLHFFGNGSLALLEWLPVSVWLAG